jgi:hypothetical protein
VLRVGRSANTPLLLSRRDPQADWTQLPLAAPVLRERLWSFESANLLLAVVERRGVEELLTSSDGGRHWRTELSRIQETSR